MKRTYKSKMFQAIYEQFNKMFEQEGDCYDTILDSIEQEYEGGNLPTGMSKKLIINILEDVTVDFYENKIEVLTEEQFLKDE
jgi:rubrerythrin